MILSVIIPVFNKEHSVERAISSVISQNLKEDEFELILIDDGSTDGSLAICENFKAKYDNVIVESKENGGVSSARNLGISVAHGDYICFLDADDFLVPGSFRLILNEFLSEEFDVIEFSGETILFESEHNQQQNSQSAEINYEIYGQELLKKDGSCTFSVCSTWFKRSFLVENNLFFEKLCIAEDVLFSLNLYFANPKIRRTSVDYYRYVTYGNNKQASRRRDELFMKKCVDSYMILFERISQVNRHFSCNESLNHCLWPMVSDNLVPFTSRLLCSRVKPKEVSEIYKKFLKWQIFPLANGNKQAKICYFIIKNSNLFNFNSFIYSKCFVPLVLPNINRNSNFLTIIDPQKKKSKG